MVDPDSGLPLPLGKHIVELHAHRGNDSTGTLTTELQCEQLESITGVCHELDELEMAIHAGRSDADETAHRAGARIVALGTSPLPAQPRLTPTTRYQEIGDRFGLTAQEHLTCGFHVHVAVESPEEGVGVLDRIRVWLPVLLALSVNSPYWNGRPTGYASYRRQMLLRLPLSGATEVFGSAKAYRDQIDQYVSSGVIVDEAMVYFDARLSRDNPTVEIRVADVCLDARTAVLIAGLARALVDTAAREWRQDVPPIPAPASLIDLAMWRASRDGLDGDLLAPGTWRPQPAAAVLAMLVRSVGRALREMGDAERIDELLAQQFARGSGARLQRDLFARSTGLADVVAMAIKHTQL